jgi:hypothetical protein
MWFVTSDQNIRSVARRQRATTGFERDVWICFTIIEQRIAETGSQIDVSDQHVRNPLSSMTEILQSDSNVTLETLKQFWKQDLPKVSTEAGMQIELRERQLLNAA